MPMSFMCSSYVNLSTCHEHTLLGDPVQIKLTVYGGINHFTLLLYCCRARNHSENFSLLS